MEFIIVWFLCLGLAVKGLEIVSSNQHRQDGKLSQTAMLAATLAVGGAALLALQTILMYREYRAAEAANLDVENALREVDKAQAAIAN